MGKGFVTPEMLHLHLIRQKGEKIFLNPEPGTRNPEPETRNQKPETSFPVLSLSVSSPYLRSNFYKCLK